MDRTYAEFGFDVVLTLAAGIGVVTYMLGLVLDPTPAAVVSVALVALGVFALVPRDVRVPAGVIGLTAVVLAGIVVPRAVTSVVDGAVPIGNELAVTLAVSGLVLLFTFALVRITAFREQDGRTATSDGRVD